MKTLIVIAIVSCALSGLFWLAFPRLLALRGVIFVRRTMFGPALIFDSADQDGTPVRILYVGSAFQSVTYLSDELRDLPCCVYHRTMSNIIAREAPTGRILVMGGGGFSLPRNLVARLARANVEAVEIDPKVIELARAHFFLNESETGADGRLATIQADAWSHIKEAEEPYDVIVNDAFSGKRPLGPVSTEEGARTICAHLSPSGIFLSNVMSPLEGRKSQVLDDTVRAFAHVFAHVYVVPERPEEPTRGGCNVLIASERALEWLSECECV